MTWALTPQSGEDNGPSSEEPEKPDGIDDDVWLTVLSLPIQGDGFCDDADLETIARAIMEERLSSSWLSQDEAESELHEALTNHKGNRTDDKTLLEEFRKQGIWLARFQDKWIASHSPEEIAASIDWEVNK